MTLNNYDINQYLPINLRINLYLANKLSHVKNIFNLSFLSLFKKVVTEKISSQLTDLYVVSEGLKQIVFDDKIQDHSKVYPHVKKALDKYQKLYFLLDSANFFDKKNIEELSDKILSNFHKTEAHIRMKACPSDCNNSDDSSLGEFATSLSLASLQEA